MSKKIYLPVDASEGKDVVSLCGRCYERVGPSEIKPNTFNASDAPESCCQCKTIWIKVPKLITDDPLDPETKWKRIAAPRCIYLADNSDWNFGEYDETDPMNPVWRGLPLLLWAVTPNGEYDDPDQIHFTGTHIVSAKQKVARDTKYVFPSIDYMQSDDWYPGHSYQLTFQITYSCRTTRCKAFIVDFSTGNIPLTGNNIPAQLACPSGEGGIIKAYVLNLALGDSIATAPTDAFRGDGATVTFPATAIDNGSTPSIFSGFSIIVPGVSNPIFKRGQELTEPQCIGHKYCAMLESGVYDLLDINGFEETLLSPGVNWWTTTQSGALEVLAPNRTQEKQPDGSGWGFEHIRYENWINGDYFVGAYRDYDYIEHMGYPEPTLIESFAGFSPIWKPFFFDPEATYVVEVDVHADYQPWLPPYHNTETFIDNNNPHDAVLYITGLGVIWDLVCEFQTVSNIGSAFAIRSDSTLEVPTTATDIGHVPAGKHRVTATIEPDPIDCTKMQVTKVGPVSTSVYQVSRPPKCELTWICVKGKHPTTQADFRDVSHNPNNLIHYGFSNLKITTSSNYRRPRYDLCKFTRYEYPNPWANNGHPDISKDWTFFRCQEVKLKPTIKEAEGPLDIKVECGQLPEGLSVSQTTGMITGVVAEDYGTDSEAEPAEGTVSFRMWDSENAHILTRDYYWIVKPVAALSVDFDTPYHNTGPAPSPSLPAVDFVYRDGTVTQLPTTDGDEPLKFFLSSGSLPDGIALHKKTGEIRHQGAGFVATNGTGNFAIRMENACGDTVSTVSYSWRTEATV